MYEFTDEMKAHEFHASHDGARWLGVIAGWYPETWRVELPDSQEAR